MERAKIQDAGLRMKLQHNESRVYAWFKAQLGRIISPIEIREFRTRQIRLSSFVSGRADFAGRGRTVAPISRRTI